MNIIVYTFPFRGHSMQAIKVANYLSNKGHQVTVDLNSSYFQYASKNIQKKECLYTYLQLPKDSQRDKLLNWAEGVFVTTKEYALKYREKADLIVFDSMAYWGKYIAESKKIPSVSLMTIQPFTKKQFYDSAYKFLLRNYISEFSSFENFMRKVHIYQVVAKKKFDLMDDFTFDDFLCARGDLNIVLLPKSMCKYSKNLEKSYKSFSPIIDYMNCVTTKNGSVYIATGSMISDVDLLISCIEALLPYKIQIYVSSGNNTRRLQDKYKNYKNIYFYEFAPQIELLNKASVFITHGGSNSICEAIATRTPMIVIPITNDEFLNAEMVAKKGIGFKIENDSNTIRSCIGSMYKKLSQDRTYTKYMDTIAKEIDSNKVWKTIDKFVEDIIDG